MLTFEPLLALDDLPANVAVLDTDGRITWVNRPWREFAVSNGWTDVDAGIGLDYLAISRAATGPFAEGGIAAADLVSDVLERRRSTGRLEYACDGPREPRMFNAIAFRLPPDGNSVCVLHIRSADRRAHHVVAVAERLVTRTLLVCAWCNREFDDVAFEWREAEPIGEQVRARSRRPGRTVTHGICERCLESVSASIEGADLVG